METSQPIEGKIIPAEVSEAVFQERNQIINGFRNGDTDGEVSYRRLLRLYWENADASDETRQWILDETFEISLEAGIDRDVTGQIWVEEMERVE